MAIEYKKYDPYTMIVKDDTKEENKTFNYLADIEDQLASAIDMRDLAQEEVDRLTKNKAEAIKLGIKPVPASLSVIP